MPQDKEFYERMGVPHPRLCPKCRLIRRMAWRNDRTFYNRTCDLSGKQFISMYPVDTPFPVYHPDAWYGDQWDPMEYGREFDFSRSFFDQWQDLMSVVPRLGIDIVNCENSYYCNYCGDDKNCYLDIAGEGNEDCYFNLFTKHSNDCADCTFAYHSQLCYESILCYRCHDVRYSMYLENCSECSFSFDLKNCHNCLFSTNLRGKQYYIFNQPHTKQEYEKKLKELNFGSQRAMQQYIAIWKEQMKNAIHRDMYVLNSENCTGNNIQNSKNCHHCFNATNSEDSAYLYDVLDATDCQDLNYSLYKPEMSYELISTLAMRFSAFCMASHYCHHSYYLDQCNNSSFLFGCIGLNQKKYCILNKQYSKEEYEKLVPKIIEHMSKISPNPSLKKRGTSPFDKGGSRGISEQQYPEWGEFFPVALSPFAYNETVAQEYFPITKHDVETKNLLSLNGKLKWKDPEPFDHSQVTKKIPAEKLPDSINDIPDDILNWAIECEQSKRPFKIQKPELKFYRKMKLPIPRLHPDVRHEKRMQLRNPRKLFRRNCAKCAKEMETTYSPERPEVVYCEACYLQEVY